MSVHLVDFIYLTCTFSIVNFLLCFILDEL